MRYKVTIAGRDRDVDVRLSPDGRVLAVTLDGLDVPLEALTVPGGVSLRLGARVATVLAAGTPEALDVSSGDARARVTVLGERARAQSAARGGVRGGSKDIRSPMPGRVVRVLIAVGDEVTAGQPVIVVEAMKMENELRAAVAGKVQRVLVKAGDTVDGNAVLVKLG